MAWRTVEREMSKVLHSSDSLGSRSPGASVPAEILRFTMLTSWEYSGMSLSIVSVLISTGFKSMAITFFCNGGIIQHPTAVCKINVRIDFFF